MRKIMFLKALAVIVFVTSILTTYAQQQGPMAPAGDSQARHVPARVIPVPTTVSPELQKVIGRPLDPVMGVVPTTVNQWHDLVAKKTEQNMVVLGQLRQLYPTDVKSAMIGGVKTYIVMPQSVAQENSQRILIHLRGGGYVFNGGEGGLGEAILMAYHGRIPVVSVDYRMAPDFPYPAALEDSIAVYKEILKTHKPSQVGIFGTSAGGGLTAATVLKLRDLDIPLPGAVGLGTPWADLTKTGDTCYTNEYIDDVLVQYEGMLEACAKLYAGSNDMKDPLISPVYGDFSKGFPATILTTGTRDFLLSDTVRMHRKLRHAGVDAYLQVFEGMSHAEYVLVFDSPESREAFQEIAGFFHKHLGS
jgi:acetyl esterase/lipase